MTDEEKQYHADQLQQLRRGLESVVVKWSACQPGRRWAVVRGGDGQSDSVGVWVRDESAETPPLTTAQQLALSVLLGEDVPIGVLVSALEESGVYPAGAVEEVRRLAKEELAKEMTASELASRLGDGFTVVDDKTVRFYRDFECVEGEEPHEVAWDILCSASHLVDLVDPTGWVKGESWSDNDSCGFDITRTEATLTPPVTPLPATDGR